MIPSTTTFANAVESNGRTFRAKIMHEGSEVQCNIIEIKPIKGSCDGETFAVGSVFSSSAEIVVSGLSEALENEDITLQIGVLNENDDFEYIDYAQYTVIKTKKSASMAILTAVGVISARLNVPIPDIAGTPTIQAVATAISAVSGVSVSFVGITGLSNTLAKGITGMTCRGALEIITFLVGGFATENNSGGIEIHKYAIPSTPVVFPEGRSLTEPVTADDTFNMTGVKVIVGTDYTITADTTVNSEKTYYTRSGSGTSADPYVYTEVEEPTGNPHANGYYEVTEKSYTSGDPIRQTYQSEYMTASMFNVFASNIVGYSFMPATVDMSLGDPRLEPWDVLSVSDGEGGSWIVPCHLLQPYFDGGFSCIVTATGESETDGGVEGTITKQISDMAGQLAVTQQSATLAKAAAKNAQASAEEAKSQAQAATGYANEAKQQAQEASRQASAAAGSANEAKRQAQSAEQSAGQALEQAQTATKYANGALDQLGVVQDVIGVLTWASEHGTFTRTQDTTVQDGKVYFIYDSQTGDYTPVVIPQESELSTYYELTVDEAMQSFIMAHLAVTARGLWVLPNGINTGSVTPAQGETVDDARARLGAEYKVLLANDGMHVYDGAGVEVSLFGENIRFNATRPQYIGGEDAFIVFDPTSGEITIGGDVLIDGTKRLSDVLTDLDVSIERTATGADITVNGDTVHLTDGEDAVNVVISSSNGMAFKNDSVETVLTVTVYYGSSVITSQTGLVNAFGAGAYLQWKAKLYGESTYSTIPASDPRLSDNGFTFTLSPSDVNVQAVFNVEVITPN